VKTVCERTEGWQGLAELLSQEEQPAKRMPDEAETNSTPVARGGVVSP
jgi:hypothetical protein